MVAGHGRIGFFSTTDGAQMIIWINGAFGAGKTTLSERLTALLPDSMLFDPELLGYAARALVPPAPSGDFQDLPLWRSLTLHAILEVRRLYDATLIIPMTLVNPVYLTEILGGLAEHGEQVAHVYLDVAEPVLRDRITAQVLDQDNPANDEQVRQWRLAQVDRCLAAKNLMPAGTTILDSGATDPDSLAAQVRALATARSAP
jgi:AAA domain